MTESAKVNKYGPVVAEVVSQRTGETYQIRRHRSTSELSCQCKAWIFSKLRPRACKHTIAAAAGVGVTVMDSTETMKVRPAAQPMPAAFSAIDRACREAVGDAIPAAMLADLCNALKAALGPHLPQPVALPVPVAALPTVRRIVLAD